jgi:hypothetical protein
MYFDKVIFDNVSIPRFIYFTKFKLKLDFGWFFRDFFTSETPWRLQRPDNRPPAELLTISEKKKEKRKKKKEKKMYILKFACKKVRKNISNNKLKKGDRNYSWDCEIASFTSTRREKNVAQWKRKRFWMESIWN